MIKSDYPVVLCVCGSIIRTTSMHTHVLSKRHMINKPNGTINAIDSIDINDKPYFKKFVHFDYLHYYQNNDISHIYDMIDIQIDNLKAIRPSNSLDNRMKIENLLND